MTGGTTIDAEDVNNGERSRMESGADKDPSDREGPGENAVRDHFAEPSVGYREAGLKLLDLQLKLYQFTPPPPEPEQKLLPFPEEQPNPLSLFGTYRFIRILTPAEEKELRYRSFITLGSMILNRLAPAGAAGEVAKGVRVVSGGKLSGGASTPRAKLISSLKENLKTGQGPWRRITAHAEPSTNISRQRRHKH